MTLFLLWSRTSTFVSLQTIALFLEISILSDQVCLNNSLKSITGWCTQWGMKLPTEESVLLRLTNKKVPLEFSYVIGSSILLQVSNLKYLGVTIQCNLNWSNHIKDICASAMQKLSLIKRKLTPSISSRTIDL